MLKKLMISQDRIYSHGEGITFWINAILRDATAINAIESVNARLRNIIKTRGHFSSDDAATELIWLELRDITENWGRATHNWKSAMNQFAILYEDRFTKSSP